MKLELYKKLAAGCGALALAASLATSAHAFDEVNWVWNADVVTSVDTSTIAITELAPTGLNQAENDQETRGNISSTSEINAFSATPDVNLTGPSLTTDLGRIETSAQAMGNSASISSDVQINYDSSQIFGGVDPETFGTVTADSAALTVTNAAVDTSATAVANNLTVDLEYATSDDAIAIGNNVQSAMADVTATSTADTVSIVGFSGLGDLPEPVVNSSSTGVGNNFSVDVKQAAAPLIPI